MLQSEKSTHQLSRAEGTPPRKETCASFPCWHLPSIPGHCSWASQHTAIFKDKRPHSQNYSHKNVSIKWLSWSWSISSRERDCWAMWAKMLGQMVSLWPGPAESADLGQLQLCHSTQGRLLSFQHFRPRRPPDVPVILKISATGAS